MITYRGGLFQILHRPIRVNSTSLKRFLDESDLITSLTLYISGFPTANMIDKVTYRSPVVRELGKDMIVPFLRSYEGKEIRSTISLQTL